MGPLWLHVIFFFLFARCFGWGCSPCRYDFEVGGCLGCFWDLISMLCIKVFLFASCFPAPHELSTPTCFLVLHKGLSLLCVFPPFLSFWHQLASFDLTLIQVFEWLLCLGFFECLKALLVHQHVLLPISMGFHLYRDHCVSNLLGELGTSSTCYCF